MKSIFINAKTQELCDGIATALDEFEAEIITCCDDEAAAAANYSDFDVIIVSTPLRNDFGLNYIADIYRKTNACIIALAKTDIAQDVQKRLQFTGAFVLGRPFSKSALVQTIRVAMLAKENIRRLEEEKSKLTQQLDDFKLLDRAKCCLIQYLNFTEAQAHRHIQKLAMDTRKTQREIAEDILRTYSGMTNV